MTEIKMKEVKDRDMEMYKDMYRTFCEYKLDALVNGSMGLAVTIDDAIKRTIGMILHGEARERSALVGLHKRRHQLNIIYARLLEAQWLLSSADEEADAAVLSTLINKIENKLRKFDQAGITEEEKSE